MRKAFQHAFEQTRLLLAEKLIGWAARITPRGHPDSTAIYQAALTVFKRRPS